MKRIVLKAGVLYDYCKEQNISRDELSRRMKVSTVTAYRVDSGKSDPSPQFIAALMDVTGLPFESLFEIISKDAA